MLFFVLCFTQFHSGNTLNVIYVYNINSPKYLLHSIKGRALVYLGFCFSLWYVLCKMSVNEIKNKNDQIQRGQKTKDVSAFRSPLLLLSLFRFYFNWHFLLTTFGHGRTGIKALAIAHVFPKCPGYLNEVFLKLACWVWISHIEAIKSLTPIFWHMILSLQAFLTTCCFTRKWHHFQTFPTRHEL